MSDTIIPAQPPPRDGPEGIGGWLILPMIGLIGTPIRAIFQLSQMASVWDNLQYLTAAQTAFIFIEAIGNVFIIIAFPIFLLVLFFNRKQSFPRFYVIWAIAEVAFTIADLIAAKILFGDVFEASGTELMDSDTWQDLLRGLVLVAIWVPYMLNSRRVRNTFIQ